MNTTLAVMVGLVPTIPVFASLIEYGVQGVDARREGEHDAFYCPAAISASTSTGSKP